MKTKEKQYISALVMGLFNQLGAHIGNSSSMAQPAKKCCSRYVLGAGSSSHTAEKLLHGY